MKTFEERQRRRERWGRLHPNIRRLLVSHHPDPMEQEENLTRDTMFALEEEGGPRIWEASVAMLAEGEAVGSDHVKSEEFEFTFQEIGFELGVGRCQARMIQDQALKKCRDWFQRQEVLCQRVMRSFKIATLHTRISSILNLIDEGAKGDGRPRARFAATSSRIAAMRFFLAALCVRP